MRRRYGIVIGALGICVGLSAGCLSPLGGQLRVPELRQAGELPAPEPVAQIPTRAPVLEVPPASRYHVTPSEPLRQPEPPRPVDADVQQTAVTPIPTTITPPPPKPEPPPDLPLVVTLRQLLEHRKPRDRERMLTLLELAVRIGDEGHRDTILDEARETLRRWMPLTLGAVCFCSEVRAFGLYKELPPDRHLFQAGVDGLPGEPMQVYIEVRDFYSRGIL